MAVRPESEIRLRIFQLKDQLKDLKLIISESNYDESSDKLRLLIIKNGLECSIDSHEWDLNL